MKAAWRIFPAQGVQQEWGKRQEASDSFELLVHSASGLFASIAFPF